MIIVRFHDWLGKKKKKQCTSSGGKSYGTSHKSYNYCVSLIMNRIGNCLQKNKQNKNKT